MRTVAHALIVHARFPEVYVHFALMYTTDHIFPVLPIKDLINKDGNPTTPHKLATGTKPSVSHLRVLFCPCVVCKATAHVETKTLNMPHQAQKGFRGIFVGIPENQKGYLVYIPSTRKVISPYDVVFDESFFVRYHIRHDLIQKRWRCVWQLRIPRMLRLLRKKLTM